MSLLSRLRHGLARLVLGGIVFVSSGALVMSDAAETQTPRPSVRLPFLRRYARPSEPTAVDRSPAKTVKGKKGKTAKIAPKGKSVSKRSAPISKARDSRRAVAKRPAPTVARPPIPVAKAIPASESRVPPSTPVQTVRQPARVQEAPTAYSGSPTNPPNSTTSTSILPFHPSTPGRKPPPKTIYLDMTRRYSP